MHQPSSSTRGGDGTTGSRARRIVTPKTGAPKMVWKREQVVVYLAADPAAGGAHPVRGTPSEDQPEVLVRGLVRRLHDEWVVSLFLINGQPTPAKTSGSCVALSGGAIRAAPDGAAIFRSRPHLRRERHIDDAVQAEQRALAMTYRARVEFAIGHGISVHAVTAPGQPDRAVRFSRRAPCRRMNWRVPTLPRPDDIDGLGRLTLDMKTLAEMPRGRSVEPPGGAAR